MNQGRDNEKRLFSRVVMNGQAHLICGEHSFEVQLLDISLKGALITRPNTSRLAIGTECRLELLLDPVVIAMEGTVVHMEAEEIGFHCEQIDLESMSHLRRLVELNLGDEDRLERELGELIKKHA